MGVRSEESLQGRAALRERLEQLGILRANVKKPKMHVFRYSMRDCAMS